MAQNELKIAFTFHMSLKESFVISTNFIIKEVNIVNASEIHILLSTIHRIFFYLHIYAYIFYRISLLRSYLNSKVFLKANERLEFTSFLKKITLYIYFYEKMN